MFKTIIISFIFIILNACQTKTEVDVKASLIGSWSVVALKPGGQGEFVPPLQPGKWEFTNDGKLKEELGNHGATIIWKYTTTGKDVMISAGSLAFKWKVISINNKEMIVNHHLGVFKVKRL